MTQFTYRCVRVRMDDSANVHVIGKRAQFFTERYPLNVGGLYFLRKNALFRVLELTQKREFD